MKRKKKKGLSFTGKIMLGINIVVVLMLLLSYLAAYISPATFWPIALLGLGYPLLLVVNLFFVLFWLFFRWKYLMLSLLAILAGFGQLRNLIQFNHPHKALPQGGTNLKVLSYNVRNFDLYSYGPGWKLDFTNRNKIYNLLKQEDYDIILFQEFVHDKTREFKTLDTIPSFLRAKDYHFEYTRSSKDVNFFGLATFSTYPIINKGKVMFRTWSGNLCIYSDILVGQDTIRVINIHFESIGLSEEDLMFVENMINIVPAVNEDQTFKKYGRRIVGRLKRAFIRRAPQVEAIAALISESPYPVILGGDFNDTPASYAYRQVSKRLRDAYLSGRGLGSTYTRSMPGFRIDYIFHSSHFKALNYKRGDQKYSDHYPVSTILHLPGAKEKD